MFKVGDKVRFKDNFRDINRGRGVTFIPIMEGLIDKELTITRFRAPDSEGIINNCEVEGSMFTLNVHWLELADPIIDISGI